jgi:hypothetical protein
MESPQINLLIDKNVLKWLDNLRWTWPSGFFFFFFFLFFFFFFFGNWGVCANKGRFIKGENHPYDDEN